MNTSKSIRTDLLIAGLVMSVGGFLIGVPWLAIVGGFFTLISAMAEKRES